MSQQVSLSAAVDYDITDDLVFGPDDFRFQASRDHDGKQNLNFIDAGLTAKW